MGSAVEAKATLEKIRNEIWRSKGAYIWRDYVNSLNVMSLVFVRSSSFILELIQNAEDAGLGLQEPGEFQISINRERIKVTHNGRPFTEEDVSALCGIRSSKKPEQGTLGYLGIGFKSVFKITDRPEIYSGEFRFKFDKNEYRDSSNTPWHVLPIWLDQPSENLDANVTTFIFPFREPSDYQTVDREVMRLRIGLYLFLRWLKKIRVTDEVSRHTWTLENVGGTDEEIRTLRRGNQQERFKFFRHTCLVPEWVKSDRLVQEYRQNVIQREIAIAFAVDSDGNLNPERAGTMYGGVYSFLPLAEVTSGATFAIQADFLVQPGREAIAYEAKWNHWLLQEVVELCKDAIKFFKGHPRWKFQFLSAFEFTRSEGDEAYERLFGPRLISPIDDYLKGDNCVPTAHGGWAKPSEVVVLTEDREAHKDLVNMHILSEEEIAPVLGERKGLRLAAFGVYERSSAPFPKVDRQNLLQNRQFLEQRSKEDKGPIWFRSLYLWLQKHPKRHDRWQQMRYHDSEIILTSDGQLLKGGEVWLPDLPPSDPLIRQVAGSLQESRAILHPDILGGIPSPEEQKSLRGFLIGFTGMQVLDSKTVCREALLPKIITATSKPPSDLLVAYTQRCKEVLGPNLEPGAELWVLTKDGDVRPAKEVIFGREFEPLRNWETNRNYVPGLHFASPKYLEGDIQPQMLAEWRQFFAAGGVKEDPDGAVEVFAMNYAEKKLRALYETLCRVDSLKFGYDMEAQKKNGEMNYVEVKGRASDPPVDLTGNEPKAAITHGDSYYLCVVCFIPDKPHICLVRNPAKLGKTEKLSIPAEVWKRYPLNISADE